MTGLYPSRSARARELSKARKGWLNQPQFDGLNETFVQLTFAAWLAPPGQPSANSSAPPPHETIASRLRSEHGFTTGAFGKWHLTSELEHHERCWNDHELRAEEVRRLGGFDVAAGLYPCNIPEASSNDATSSFSHNPEWVNDAALQFIDGALAGNKRFFAYVAHTLPHTPFAGHSFDSTEHKYGVRAHPPGAAPFDGGRLEEALAARERAALYIKTRRDMIIKRAMKYGMCSGEPKGKDRVCHGFVIPSQMWFDHSVGEVREASRARPRLTPTPLSLVRWSRRLKSAGCSTRPWWWWLLTTASAAKNRATPPGWWCRSL